MEVNEFARAVIAGLKEMLGDSYIIEQKEVLKNNSCMRQGIQIKHIDGNIAPVIYVDDFYRAYVNGAIDVETAARKCFEIFRENEISIADMGYVMDFEKIRKDISYKVINFEENSKLLENLVYSRFMDLAVVYYINVNDVPKAGKGSIMIKKEYLKTWGVKKKDVSDAAIENSRNEGYYIRNIFDLIIDMKQDAGFEMFRKEHRGESGSVFVLSNNESIYGAKIIYEVDKLEKIAEKLGERFYILPSSVHELILIKDDGICELEHLKDMVHEVNRTAVMPEEVLSDNVYVYDNNCKSVVIA